jgi:hypothetical protein
MFSKAAIAASTDIGGIGKDFVFTIDNFSLFYKQTNNAIIVTFGIV